MNAQQQVSDLLAKMMDVVASKNGGKIPHDFERMSDEISTLTSAYLLPSPLPDEFDNIGITKSHMRIVALLHARLGRLVSKSAIFDAVYFDKSECDIADIKIIDIFICKIRPKLESTPYRIETVWGQGFRMVKQQ